MMRFIYIILNTTFLILLLGFAFKNTEPVALHYYLGYSWEAPLLLMLFISFIIGIVTGLIAFMPLFIRQRRELLALNVELKMLKPDD